jgi:hypothetical protein
MRRALFAIAAMLIAGCSEQSITPRQPALTTSEVTFLRLPTDVYASAQKTAEFWAVKGQNRSVTLSYTDTGQNLMLFSVGADALATRPDGSAFQPGDSVLISVTLDESARLIFRFQPSGLKFSDAHPAELTVDGTRADPDVNGDGVLDLRDTVLRLQASIWKQDLPGLPWLKLPTVSLSSDVVRSDIHDFTGFGMAVN